MMIVHSYMQLRAKVGLLDGRASAARCCCRAGLGCCSRQHRFLYELVLSHYFG